MASYISAKKKEVYSSMCSDCGEQKEIASWIRNEMGELKNYCKSCFEIATGKKVSKR
ncbi:MAG: hypothetical protein OEV44_09610 [Spirochaetota bacterium]|nr:hypothetical protein [Spirochaetota bacterium]